MKMITDRIQPVLLCVLMVMVAMVAATTGAHAQDMTSSGLFDTFVAADGDAYTNTLLNQIFGPIFDPALGAGSEGGTGNTGATLFSEIVGWFNAAMLVIAGILFFNNLVTGTVQTAHEGEVMGRNWSSLWAPLRTIMAVALLIPLPNMNGYNTAQVFVAFIAKNATNFASAAWSITVRNIATDVLPISAPAGAVPQNMASQMFLLEMCKVILDTQFAESAGSSTPATIRRNATQATSFSPAEMGWLWALSPIAGAIGAGVGGETIHTYRTEVSYDHVGANGRIIKAGACGSYQTPDVPDVISNRVAAARVDGLSLADTLSDTQNVRNVFQTLHTNVMGLPSEDGLEWQVPGLAGAMERIAQQTYNHHVATLDASTAAPPPLDISADLQAAVEEANETLNAGFENISMLISNNGQRNASVRQAMVDRISTDCGGETQRACLGEGWIGAGSWYMMIARLNAEIASLYAAEGEAQAAGSMPTNGTIDFRGNSSIMSGSNALAQQYAAAFDYGAQVFNIAANRMAAAGWPVSPAMVNNLAASFQGADIASEYEDNIKWNGSGAQTKLNTGATQMIVWANSATFANDPMISLINIGQTMAEIGTVLILSDILLPGNVASTIGGTLATAGVTMAIILPLMPFLFWIMAVTGYFLLVVEAFLAVNLWAISHLRMDGEGLSGGAGREGWLMLLALMVTPFLMVAGYIVGMIIFRISASLITSGLAVAIAGILSGGGAIFTMVSMMVIGVFMVIFYMLIIERSFSLVAEFPNKVLRWMGAAANLDTGGVDRVRTGALAAIGSTHNIATTATKGLNYGPWPTKPSGSLEKTKGNETSPG